MLKNILVDPFPRDAFIPAEPLPDDVVVRLRSDPTAALAAALIVASAFPGIVSWAARSFGGQSHPKRCAEGGDANGGAGRDEDDSPPRRRQASDQADQQLLALMRDNPGATITQLVRLSGRSRSSIVMSLKRLEEAGLVDHGGHGSWAAIEDDPDLIDEGPPLPPKTAHWVAPLSGKHVARHAVDGRVPEEAAAS
jgi:MarR family